MQIHVVRSQYSLNIEKKTPKQVFSFYLSEKTILPASIQLPLMENLDNIRRQTREVRGAAILYVYVHVQEENL